MNPLTQSPEAISQTIQFYSLLGGSTGDIVPATEILSRLQKVLTDLGVDFYTGISSGAVNSKLISDALNKTLLEDPIGELISKNINGNTNANLMQFGNIYLGMYKKVGDAVLTYYDYLSKNGFFENTGPKVLLINPSTYPTIAPIIKYLESKQVLVLQIDEVGNNPNGNRVDSSPMLPGLSPRWSNFATSLSLNLIAGKAAKLWRQFLGDDVNVENHLPKDPTMLFAHARSASSAISLNDEVISNNIDIIDDPESDVDERIYHSLIKLFPEQDPLEIYKLINELGILYIPRIAKVPENVVLDEEISGFLDLDGEKVFLNSSSFDLEKDHDILIDKLSRFITEYREKYGKELRIILNDGKEDFKHTIIPEHLKNNIYISRNPNYLTVLFHDQRVETIISTFGQGSADLASAFAEGKRIIGLNFVTDQKANINHLNLMRAGTDQGEIPSISWQNFTTDLLHSEISNKPLVDSTKNIEEITKGLDLRIKQGAVFMLMRMYKSLNISEDQREIIKLAINYLGEQ